MDYFNFLEKDKGIKLNDEQKKAVNFNFGNALVLSTAGSGKTTVIVTRTGRLIYDNVCKNKILTITFSKMAADDMKKRFSSVFEGRFRMKADFSTIHSFLYKIVRDYYRRNNMSVTLVNNSYIIIDSILKDIYQKEYYSTVNEEEVENIVSKISYVSNMMIGINSLDEYNFGIKYFKEIIEKYRYYKKSNNLLDFDDILLYGYRLLKKVSFYRDTIKKKYDFIQVDEMQDTSKIQHAILSLISNNNLFMVGDDDQSIYSFRGSFPEYMLKFKEVYKDGQVFYLSKNYRSDGNIVKAAKRFIETNETRYKKSIENIKDCKSEVKVINAPNRVIQCKYIIKQIKDNNYKNIGILYRNNISSLIIANALYENNFNFFIKDDKTKFFKSFVLNDVISFIKLSLNNYDRESFSKIYYKSYTYFNKNMCNYVLNYNEDNVNVFEILKRCPNLKYYMYDRINNFKSDINFLKALSPEETIKYIKNDLEYVNYLQKLNDDGRCNLSSSMLILDILQEISSYCNTIDEFFKKIDDLKNILSECSSNFGADITLSSIHSSKGLEYDVVFMVDNIKGEFPPDRRNESIEEYMKIIEEERRIFYVGITRAKKELNVVVPDEPSIFVNELTGNKK